MRNLLALIALIILGFAAVGWYCEWYTFTVTKGPQGKPEIKTTVDTEKVSDDSEAFFKRMGQLIGEKAKESDPKGVPPAVAPGNAPGPIAPVKGGSSGLSGTR